MVKNSVQKMKIQPLFDNVLIKPLEAAQKTPSGIHLPDTVKEKPQIGEVMAIGAKHKTSEGVRHLTAEGKFVPVVLEEGQKVMYKKWGGNEVKVGNEEWVLVEQKDILAIVD